MSLRELHETIGRAVMQLRVGPSQTGFVAPNSVSLTEAFLTTDVLVRGIFAGEEPVGFLMVSTCDQHYYLWRFMIDHRHQRRGYGRQAMEQLIELLEESLRARELRLSYLDVPGGPAPFYERLGFRETGEVHDGERIMVRCL